MQELRFYPMSGRGAGTMACFRGPRTAAALLASLLFGLLLEVDVNAADLKAGSTTAQGPRTARPKRPRRPLRVKAPYRDSEVIYRNVVSARSFDRDADLTYNPYYAMELELAPVFWLHEKLYAALDVALTRELTDSDKTTKRGETVLEDVFLAFGAPRVWTAPVLKIHLIPSIRFYFPTSKVSRARTLILGIQPRLELRRRFDILRGLILSYRIAFRGNLHEATTAESEAPLVSGAVGSTRSLESFSNLGVRNDRFGISNTFSLELDIKRWLGLRIAVAIIHGFLYDLTVDDERISYEPQTATDVRYWMAYNGELYARPLRYLTVAVGFITENYQLAPDSTYEAPFFNRYTAPYLDLRLDVAALSKQLKKKRGRK